MPRPTKQAPERGDARTRLLQTALDVIREQGYAATTVDQLCQKAAVTKGAFFHHFENKQALGVAAAQFWSQSTARMFASAAYHEHADPLQRVLGYIQFRRSLIVGAPAQYTCLAGTLTQELHASHPAVRDACAASIFEHAATLEADIAAAMESRGVRGDWSAASLARHTQAVLQGAFILAKAADDPAPALESIDHLQRYVALLFAPHHNRTKPGGQHHD